MKYLDYDGLQTVVENIKNLVDSSSIDISDLQKILLYIGDIAVLLSNIRNVTASSPDGVFFNTVSKKFIALQGSDYYNKWNSTDKFQDYTKYGDPTSGGVNPSVGFLYCNTVNKKLLTYFGNNHLEELNANSSTITWTTVPITNSPFKDADGYVTKVEYRKSENDTYIWRITIDNLDGEYQEWNVYNGNDYVQPGVYLNDSDSGYFTIELPKNMPKNKFTIKY